MSVHSDYRYKINNNLMTEQDWDDYYADLAWEYRAEGRYPEEDIEQDQEEYDDNEY